MSAPGGSGPRGGVCSGGGSAPGWGLLRGECLLPGVSARGRGVPGGDPPGMATAAGGTHPTGMYSCGLARAMEKETLPFRQCSHVEFAFRNCRFLFH